MYSIKYVYMPRIRPILFMSTSFLVHEKGNLFRKIRAPLPTAKQKY